jgi:hypothetical protein
MNHPENHQKHKAAKHSKRTKAAATPQEKHPARGLTSGPTARAKTVS